MKKAHFFLVIFSLVSLLHVSAAASITGWKYFDQKHTLNSNYITCAAPDTAGNMWFGTGGGAMMLSADGTTWTKHAVAHTSLMKEYVYCMFVDRDNNKWFGMSGGVSKLSADGKTWKSYDRTTAGMDILFRDPNQCISGIMQDKDGTMWFRLTGSEWITHEVVDANGNLIIYYIGSGGIAKLDSDAKWSAYSTNDQVASFTVKHIDSFMKDRSNNLWFSSSGGVSRLAPDGSVKTYTGSNSGLNLDANGVKGMFQDKAGNMWFSLRHRGVSKLSADGTTWTSYSENNSGLADDWVSMITQDKAGNMWFGSETGQGASVLSADGKSWVTYTGAGAYNRITKRYVEPEEINDYEYPDCLSTAIDCIVPDSSGNMWIGTHGHGLAEAVCVPLFAHTERLGIGTETGSSASLKIVSDVPWTATTTVNWLSVFPASGPAGTSVVTVTKTAAGSPTAISSLAAGAIIFRGNDGSEFTVSVEPSAFTLSTESVTLGADQWSNAPIAVSSNALWTLTYAQKAMWFILVSDSGLTREDTPLTLFGTDTIGVIAAEHNRTVVPRTTTLNFTAGTAKKTVTVRQDALLNLSTHAVVLDSVQNAGGWFMLKIGTIAGAQWTAATNSPWLTIGKTSGRDSSATGLVQIALTAASKNSGVSFRSAHLVVSASGLKDTIVVYQKGTDGKEITSARADAEPVPNVFALEQNYPNPFNPSTVISFSLPSTSFATLKVFDVMGREAATVVAQELPAGRHMRLWNAQSMPSGVYFYRLTAGALSQTKRLLLLR